MSKNKYRPDQDGTHRAAFERAKKKIYATQTVCGICGRPVDFGLKYPNPLSPCIDHILPIAKGGHPSDMANLQLAHWCCNRQKADKLPQGPADAGSTSRVQQAAAPVRMLPQSRDWASYRPG